MHRNRTPSDSLVTNRKLRVKRERETMSRYFIESPHTKEECLTALDEALAKGPDVLGEFDWGCMAGDHTAYGVVEARTEAEAREMVPAIVRSKARIVTVDKVTPDMIRSFHEH